MKSTVIKIVSIVLAVLALAGFLYKRETNYVSQIEAMQKTQAEALDKINKIREQEKAQTDEAIKNYEKALNDVSTRYAKALKDLDSEKKKRRDEILLNKDPKVLADKLAESMKLKVQP